MKTKKIILLAAIVFAIVFTSCSKDSDSSDSPISSTLVGTWQVAAYSFEGRTTTVAPDNVSFYDFTGDGGQMDFNMVFSDDPNKEYTLNGYYNLDNYIFTDDGQTYFYQNFNTFDDEGNWELNNNFISLMILDDTFNAGITELTDDILTFTISTSWSETLNDGLTVITTIKNETYAFERASF